MAEIFDAKQEAEKLLSAVDQGTQWISEMEALAINPWDPWVKDDSGSQKVKQEDAIISGRFGNDGVFDDTDLSWYD